METFVGLNQKAQQVFSASKCYAQGLPCHVRWLSRLFKVLDDEFSFVMTVLLLIQGPKSIIDKHFVGFQNYVNWS